MKRKTSPKNGLDKHVQDNDYKLFYSPHCGHCHHQLELLGYNVENPPYYATNCSNGCNNIEAYPTWILPNNKKILGVVSTVADFGDNKRTQSKFGRTQSIRKQPVRKQTPFRVDEPIIRIVYYNNKPLRVDNNGMLFIMNNHKKQYITPTKSKQKPKSTVKPSSTLKKNVISKIGKKMITYNPKNKTLKIY